MTTTRRILLVEHLDAIGSSLTDLKPRAQVLRGMGFDVRMAAIAAEGDGDLQHGNAERRQNGIEHYDEARGTDLVRRAIESWDADGVVWASSSPGGGEAARALGTQTPAWWWPSGWSTSRANGPLPRLAPELDPGDASVMEGERPKSAQSASVNIGPVPVKSKKRRSSRRSPAGVTRASRCIFSMKRDSP